MQIMALFLFRHRFYLFKNRQKSRVEKLDTIMRDNFGRRRGIFENISLVEFVFEVQHRHSYCPQKFSWRTCKNILVRPWWWSGRFRSRKPQGRGFESRCRLILSEGLTDSKGVTNQDFKFKRGKLKFKSSLSFIFIFIFYLRVEFADEVRVAKVELSTGSAPRLTSEGLGMV